MGSTTPLCHAAKIGFEIAFESYPLSFHDLRHLQQHFLQRICLLIVIILRNLTIWFVHQFQKVKKRWNIKLCLFVLVLLCSGNHSCSAGSVKYNDTDPCWGSVTRKDAYRVFLVSPDSLSQQHSLPLSSVSHAVSLKHTWPLTHLLLSSPSNWSKWAQLLIQH